MAKQKISRAQWLMVGLFVVMIVFAIRLFSIQILDHDKYLAQAEQMQTSKRTINPTRGRIFLRGSNGELAPLVLNQTVYTVFADPSQVKDAAKIREVVKKIGGDRILEDNLTDAKLTDKENQYLVLTRQLTNSEVAKIKDENLAGVGFQATARRVYPEGNLAAQVLGFVNSDGAGQYGVEQFLNQELSGEPGLLQAVTDVRRIPLVIGANDISVPAQDGVDCILTIDRGMQSEIEKILQQNLTAIGVDRGSVLVANPQNGQILAMANYPTFDPAEYNKVQNGADFQNFTTSYAFEPGSVMKVLTTGMTLDLGKISPNTTFQNTGCVQVDDRKICNLSRSVDGRTMTMTEVLQWSLNTGVVWQLEQIGGGEINFGARQKMYDYFSGKYRFGAKTGIEQSGEAAGTIPKPDTPHGARPTYANMTFGQGMNVTMVQFAAAFSASINGGIYYQPTLIAGTVDENGAEKLDQPKIIEQNMISEKASNELKQMIYESRRANNSTAYNGYYVGAKTGTAQIYDQKTGKYSETKTTGTAIGFGADKDKTPQYVIMVRLDDYEDKGRNMTAGTQALRIFDAAANFINQYEGITK